MEILFDFVVEFIMEILPEWNANIIGVNPIKIFEKKVHNKVIQNILIVIVATICLIIGVLIAVGIVIGVVYLISKFA